LKFIKPEKIEEKSEGKKRLDKKELNERKQENN
jgi:hypothetical protein